MYVPPLTIPDILLAGMALMWCTTTITFPFTITLSGISTTLSSDAAKLLICSMLSCEADVYNLSLF